jgi:hypothetical protein
MTYRIYIFRLLYSYLLVNESFTNAQITTIKITAGDRLLKQAGNATLQCPLNLTLCYS